MNSRTVYYLVGVDGRVQASNGAPSEVLQRALGHYRLRRANVPESMKSIRDAIWQYRLGAALQEATRAAAAADASAEAKAVATRVTALAEEDVASRGQWAAWLRAQGAVKAGELRQAVDELVREYAGGPLQAKAEAVKRQQGL